MGISIFGRSWSSYDKPDTKVVERVIEKPVYIEKTVKLPNPDPYNWVVNQSLQMGRFLLVAITYPDCTNYEGKKIMVYENATINDLKKQRTVDPHFSSNKKFHSPIARFEPTQDGWKMAQKMVELLLMEEC